MEQDHILGVEDLTDDEKKYAISVRENIIEAARLGTLQQVVAGKDPIKYVVFGWGIAAALIGQIIELRRRIVALEKRSQ